MTTRPGRMTGHVLAGQLFAGRDPGRTCRNCRFFDETRGTEPAVCRRHKIRTSTAASCREYDRRPAKTGRQ